MLTKTSILSTVLILGAAALSPALAMKTKAHVNTMSAQSVAQTIDQSNDVYLNGEYVGSDPDVRIRWSILEEARGKVGM